jgi:TetR/AcrR family transcriptional regulator, cholesterol catabolism regulator
MPARQPQATKETKATRTRRRILDAAAAEFAEHGYTETSLRRVAAASGLQLGSLYFHFPSKELLAKEVLNEGIEIALTRIQQAIDALHSEATAAERMTAAIEAHIQALTDAGAKAAAVVRMIDTFPDQVREQQAPLLRLYARTWTQLIKDAQAQKAIDARLDPRLIRELLIAAMNGTLHVTAAPEALARTLANLTLNPSVTTSPGARPRRTGAAPAS